MRWKLASGGVVGTTKQPLQWKDFDRIEITDDSAAWGSFDIAGVPGDGDIEFEIKLYNPSTHTIAKSYHRSNHFRLEFETVALGNDGSRYTNVTDSVHGQWQGTYHLTNLDYGDVTTWYVYPQVAITNHYWTQRVTPFNISVWGGHDLSDFYPDTFNYPYLVRLVKSRNGGRINNKDLTIKNIPYIITYQMR